MNSSLYVFGGWDGVATLNDLWEYNIVSSSWKELRTEGEIIKG